jgi:plasmid stabilization system protein ParE
MPYQIIWSPTAKATYFQILDYLSVHWSSQEVINFIERTEEVLAYIKENPLQYSSSKIRTEIHRCVATKDISLFYQVNKQSVELFVFWDNRQDPSKLSL